MADSRQPQRADKKGQSHLNPNRGNPACHFLASVACTLKSASHPQIWVNFEACVTSAEFRILLGLIGSCPPELCNFPAKADDDARVS